MSKEHISGYLNNYNGEKIVMFGASHNAELLMSQFEIDNILCFCDNDTKKHGKKFKDIYDIISVDALIKINKPVYVLISSDYFPQIYRQLKASGFTGSIDAALRIRDAYMIKKFGQARINEAEALLNDELSKETYRTALNNRFVVEDSLNYSRIVTKETLYFNKSIFRFTENEVYVDAGAIGESSFDFIDAVNGKFDKIYCFEPSKKGFSELCTEYERRNIPEDKYKLFNAGIYSHTDNSYLYEPYDGSHSSFVVDDTGEQSLLKSEMLLYKLDDVIKDRVSFIKMDIEGSELAAIKGGERIIREYKPKLTICLYHKITDFWNIPLEINRICPEYKIYIRHHTESYLDTVLYAYV